MEFAHYAAVPSNVAERSVKKRHGEKEIRYYLKGGSPILWADRLLLHLLHATLPT